MLDFNKFERAQKLLEQSAPFDIDEQLLESNGLTRDELEAVNEGFLKDLFGGWFKKMKTAMLRKIPGGVLSKVDKIVAKYEAEKLDLMKRSLKEKEKMYKAEVGADSDPSNKKKYEQIVDRANQAIKAIKTASNAKIEKFNTELEQAADGKSDMVADYINLKIAEVKEKVAMSELKEIEKFATEDQVDKATKEVEDKKKEREDLQKNLEAAVKSAKTLAGANAKKGEKWVRKNNKGEEVTVEVLDDPSKLKDGEIQVKGKDGTEYSAKIESFLKQADGNNAEPTQEAKVVTKLENTIDKSVEALTKDDEKKMHRLIGQLMNNIRDAGNREEEVKYKLQLLVAEERLLQKHKSSLGAKISLQDIEKEREELLAELDQIGVDKVMSTKVDKMTLGPKNKKIIGLSKENPLDLKVVDE